jgi:dihydroorotase (multifunctional complex type)
VHGEDEEAVRLFTESRRPPICAELAAGRAVALARHIGRRLHLCHVSTAAEIELVTLARRAGLPVTCEVTPHHLFLSTDDEAGLGTLGMMNPPLRSPEDVAALWANLSLVDMVASDHAPHTLEEKRSAMPPAGVPGLETMLPLLIDAALSGRLSLPTVARLTSASPAGAFCLRHKGQIAAGYHADVVLLDPEADALLGQRIYSKCGWTPFAGRHVQGCIRRVLLRGRDALLDGEVISQPGWGRFLAPHPA